MASPPPPPPAASPPPPPPPPTLLTLPPELRLRIYSLALPSHEALLVGRARGPLARVARWRPPALVQASAQLRREARALFLGRNTFVVSVLTRAEFAAAARWLVLLGGGGEGAVRDLQFSIGEAVLVDVVSSSAAAGRGAVFVDGEVVAAASAAVGWRGGRVGVAPAVSASVGREILAYMHLDRGLKARIELVLESVRREGLQWRFVALLLRVIFKREAFERATWRAVRRVEGIEGLDV
ncbi:hypothetical protein MBLNU459_g2489t1 [Dothideomycetes sp. NU459]